MLTLTQMRYFSEVCRWQSVSRAASALHVSQPTVSVAIKDMEKDLGLNLFKRDGRRLVLTEEGEAALSKISPLLTGFGAMEEELRDLAGRHNTIRLGVPLQIGVRLLPVIFGQFRRENPDIELEIVEAGGIDSSRMVENEELDMAVCNYDDDPSPLLNYRRICRSRLCFCCSKDHPLAKKSSVRLEEAGREDLVLLGGSFFTNRAVAGSLARIGISPKVILYSRQLHTIKNLVRQNVACTFLMRQTILPTDDIAALDLEPDLSINTGIITKRGRLIYSGTKKLSRFILEKFKTFE